MLPQCERGNWADAAEGLLLGKVERSRAYDIVPGRIQSSAPEREGNAISRQHELRRAAGTINSQQHKQQYYPDERRAERISKARRERKRGKEAQHSIHGDSTSTQWQKQVTDAVQQEERVDLFFRFNYVSSMHHQ